MAIGDKMAGQTPAQQYSNQRPNPDAFGAGVSRAIFGLAGATEDAADTAAAIEEKLRLREEKKEDFEVERRYIEYIGEQNRKQAERIRGAQESADGITNLTGQALEEAKEGFIKTLPARLQAEYRTKIETFEQNTITSAFNYEYTAGNEKFVKDINDTLNDEASEILLGNKSADEARDNIFGLIERSDLDEASKRDLRDQAEAFLLRAEFQKEVEYSVEFRGTVKPKTEGDVVAAGLLPHERGILNAISRPESSDRYDVMYGGKKITDFSDHPRQYHEIQTGPNAGKKTSAAGKYQFLASTWDQTVREYNAQHPNAPIRDFSPESQDRAALFLARKIYNRQLSPGEMTFDQVLTSGNRELIGAMKDALTDAQGGWEGFRDMSQNAFTNIVMGAAGIAGGGTGSPGVPDIWSDPKYAGLDFAEKNKLALYAKQEVDNRDTEAARLAKAQREALTEQTMMEAIAGKYTLADQNMLIKEGKLPDSAAVTKWQGLVDKAQGDAAELRRIGAALNSGGPLYPSDNKGLNLFLGDKGRDLLHSLDKGYAENQLLPIAMAAGFFPSDTAKDLNAMMSSRDQSVREYATGILAAAYSADPGILDRSPGLEEGAKKQLLLADDLRRLYTPDEVQERMRQINDPMQAQAVNAARKEARKIAEENFTTEDVLDVFDTWWLRPSITRGQNAQLMRDFTTAFAEGYVLTGDKKASEEYAKKMLIRHWKVSPIGGAPRLTKFSPDTFYPKIEGSHDWIELQAREELQFNSDTQFQLIADAQTEIEGNRYLAAEDKKGVPNASYTVAYLDERGFPQIMLDEDGQPIRWRAEITPEMEGRISLAAQYEGLVDRLESITKSVSVGAALTPELRQEAENIRNEMEEIRQQAGDRDPRQVLNRTNRRDLEEELLEELAAKERYMRKSNPLEFKLRKFDERIEALKEQLENM